MINVYQFFYLSSVTGHAAAIAIAIFTWCKFNREFCKGDKRWWRFIHRFINNKTERAYYITVLGTISSVLMGLALIKYIIYDSANTTSHEALFVISHVSFALAINAAHLASYIDLDNARCDATAS